MQSFLNIRSHGFVRVAAIIPKVVLANPIANAHNHLAEINNVYDKGAQYILCPELGLSGYSCGDLFHSQELLDSCLEGLEILIDNTRNMPVMISVGMPLRINGYVFNVAITFYGGKIVAVVPKSYPPNNAEFYEGRHFARASELPRQKIDLLDQTNILLGTNILITHPDNEKFVLHTEICEDGWVPIPPSTKAALAGATVLANLSASNITIGKNDYRRQLMMGTSAKNIAVAMYCAAGFGESTSDLSWDGDAMIAERGKILSQSDRFQLNGTHILCDVDMVAIEADRMRQTSFRQNASDMQGQFYYAKYQSNKDDIFAIQLRQHDYVFQYLERSIDPHPFVPTNTQRRDERCYETFMIQATALARRLESLPEGMKKIVIGVSGGQDSTHALNVAVYAMDMLNLPRTNIIGITMPGFGTTKRTRDNATLLCEALGVTFRKSSIIGVAKEIFGLVDQNEDDYNLVFENTQAWSRKLIELATSCKFKGLVLGTGDMSELALGWCTYGGDHLSHYGINAGVPKTLISFLIGWTAEKLFTNTPEVKDILLDILDTDISPELLPASDDDKITQVTEDIVGPYELHDFFMYYFVRFGFKPSRIARLAKAAFDTKYSMSEIKKWLRVFITRFFSNQFKRSFLPEGPKVGLTCLSPRGDWRMPSDAEVAIWLKDLQIVPED